MIPSMRMASKLFFASSLVILALLVVAGLSMGALERLVRANREISTRTVPALRLSVTARDEVSALGRLEARSLVLGDPQYAALWEERVARLSQDLDHLQALILSKSEAPLVAEAQQALIEYRQRVAEARRLVARGERQAALRVAERETRPLLEQISTALEHVTESRHAAVAAAQSSAARLEARTWRGVLMALGVAVGLALLVTAWLTYRITRSLRLLAEATAGMAAGSYHAAIVPAGRDELGDLARSFNAMAERIRQMDDTKQEFFARISHELRSPLTSVRESAHLLSDGVPGVLNPKQARLVAIIEQSSDRLLRLVNQLLELSRARAGLLELDRRPVDLERLVARVLEELRPQAEEAGVTLAQERMGQDVAYIGDEDRLIEVIVNLVANGIRFTPPGGSVVVRLIDAGPEVHIQVEDTGVGIASEALASIFESYQQAHADRGGTGLGLAIVRGMVQAHGGRVTAESEEGKGSRFTVVLPRRPGPA